MIVMLSCIASSFIFSLPPIHLRLFHAGVMVTQAVSAMLVSSLQVMFFSLVHLLLSILRIQHLIAYLYLFSHMLAGRPGSQSMHSPGCSMSDIKIKENFLHTSALTLGQPIPKQVGDKAKMEHCSVALSVHPPKLRFTLHSTPGSGFLGIFSEPLACTS